MFFIDPVTIIEFPKLEKHQEAYFVKKGQACIANYHTPIMTGGIATCSTLIVHDRETSRQMLAHVGPMDHSGDIRDGINKHFNTKSDSLLAIIIPGSGISGTQPTLSVPIAQEALTNMEYAIVDNWYTNYLEFISIHNGVIQKNDKKSIKTVKESLPRSLICKSF